MGFLVHESPCDCTESVGGLLCGAMSLFLLGTKHSSG